jgi:hypothetical protein
MTPGDEARPQPAVQTARWRRFFTWIVSLLPLVAGLAPFMTDTKVATAAINLAIG